MNAFDSTTLAGLCGIAATAGLALWPLFRTRCVMLSIQLGALAGTPFWLLHDILIESPVMLADGLSLLIGLVALVWRNGATRSPAQQF